MTKLSRRAALGGVAAAAAAWPRASLGQSATAWSPAGPVRVVVPFPPGGTMDIVARQLAPALQEELRQSIVTDNRPGAGTVIGTEAVARSAPDGQTILMMANSFLINGTLQRNLPYDPLRDFAPVALLTVVPHVLVTHPSVAADFAGFVAAAKRRNLSIGTYGTGTSNHLGAEQLRLLAGFEGTHVPYRGGAQAYPDLNAGRIDFMFANLPDVLQPVAVGSWRAHAIAMPQRTPQLPAVPALAELGLGEVISDSWFGVVLPAATRPEVVARHEAAWLAALGRPEMRARLADQGFTVLATGAAEFGARMRRDFATYAEVIRRANVRPD
jgi:tripartite-type tricarboxylate transporter receptor subunit TctC